MKQHLLARPVGIVFMAFCLVSRTAPANPVPKSVPRENSAAAAELSPTEVGTRVAELLTGLDHYPTHYAIDIQLEALLALGDATGEEKYLAFVQRVMRDRGTPPDYVHPYQTQAFCSLPFTLYRYTRDSAYVEPFVSESVRYRTEGPRAFDGAISRYDENDAELAMRGLDGPIDLDHLQEYASRMAKTGWLTDDLSFYEEAGEQFRLLRDAVRDPETGLWGHGRGWYETEQEVANIAWGRGQAWLLRGLVETLSYLPPESDEYREILAMLKDLARTLVEYQDTQGLWHQVVNRSDSYLETSVTGLVSYYLARAVRQGLLPEAPYAAASVRAYEALMRHKVSADGVVYGATWFMPIMQSAEEYMNWRTPVNDPHGVAAVLFSAAGQLLLEGKGQLFSRSEK